MFFSEAWSLAVEEIFYLFFPALFLLLANLFRLTADRAILLAAVLVLLGSLAARGWVAPDVSSWDEEIRKVAYLRFDTLMFGVLLASLGCAGLVIVGIGWTPPRAFEMVGGFMARIPYSAYLVNIPVAMTLVFVAKC